MPADNHSVILSRFKPWMYVSCWVLCNRDKQPATTHAGHYSTVPERDYGIGWRLRWKSEPQDHITGLEKVSRVSGYLPGYGIGPLLGRNNPLACFDFDHCLNADGDIVNEKVKAFITVLSSYCEVSVSGTGLHVFVTIGQPEAEYGFNPGWIGDGKFYTNRFIRLTGNEYREHQYSVKAITHKEYEQYRLFLEHPEPKAAVPTAGIPKASTYKGSQSWDRILTDAGILYRDATEYNGKIRTYPDGTSRTVENAYRILCPNYLTHSNHENRDKRVANGGGDVAILTKFCDGMSAVKCGHNHCDGVNLLQMLWDGIKKNRASNVKTLMESAGVKV